MNFKSDSEKSMCRKNIPRYITQAAIKYFIEPENFKLVEEIC